LTETVNLTKCNYLLI